MMKARHAVIPSLALGVALGALSARRTPATEAPSYTVAEVSVSTVRLDPVGPGRALEVPADSLSRTVRPGEEVRRCWNAVSDERGHVTWCRVNGRR